MCLPTTDLEVQRVAGLGCAILWAPVCVLPSSVSIPLCRQQDLAEQRQLERQRLTQLLFTEAELHAIQSSFDQSKALAYTDALSIMKLMGQDDPQGRRGLKDLLADKQVISAFLSHYRQCPPKNTVP